MKPEAPLIYISCSHKDEGWKIRLLKHLQAFEQAGQLSVWDDSRIEIGQKWLPEIEQALASCHLALLLVSPNFLVSSFINNHEVPALLKRSEAEGVRVIPVILEPCDWKKINWLASILAWPKNGMPLSEMKPDEAETSLADLAREIRALLAKFQSAQAKRADTEQKPAQKALEPDLDFKFSDSMKTLINLAQELAKRSGRSGITSSCLMFALAESAGSRGDTAQFFRGALENERVRGKYHEAFEEFLNEKADNKGVGIHVVGGIPGKISGNTRDLLLHAQSLATQVSGGSPIIHQRHLLAAFITFPGQKLYARSRLLSLGIELPSLRIKFRDFIRDIKGLKEDLAVWDKILVPDDPPSSSTIPAASVSSSQPPFISGPAGYTSEYCGVGGHKPVADHLGVEAAAHRLAELIALRETRLPLAVGLFGDWGSGKSHFMNLMDRHIQELAGQAREKQKDEAGVPASPWHGEIVPVYFNAWHYIDTNLWASLVTEIFDKLITHLQKDQKEDELETLRGQLKEAGGAMARAEEEAERATQAVKQAEDAYQQARSDSLGASNALESMVDDLSSLLPQMNTEESRRRLAGRLGIKAEDMATLSRFVEKFQEMSSWPSRIQTLGRRMVAREGLAGRIVWLVGTVVVVPCVLWLKASWLPEIESWLRNTIAIVMAAIGPAKAIWPVFEKVQGQLAEMEDLQKQAEKAQQARSETPEVKAAAEKVERAKAAEVGAQADLAAARALERQLALALDEAQPNKRLTRFIEARARSADYRGQLGLVSLVRKDFEALSELFANAEALAKKLKTLRQADDPAQNRLANETEKLSRSLDRIVLFVDDLDRCQPERVVDVLQAVHLLLAFPLFAVVVGVDQRCLRQSLKMQFKGLLTPERDADPNAPKASRSEQDERPATPLDYLEKIFHIPFHLPPMEEKGFSNLIEKLTEPPTTPAEGKSSTNLEVDSADAALVEDIKSKDEKQPIDGEADTDAAKPFPVEEQTQPPPEPHIPQTIGSVPLHRWERDALKDYHALIRTPRGATRLLNTYRLVRAGVPKDDWDAFRGDEKQSGEFRVAMLLLAAAAGHPASARNWFDELRGATPTATKATPSEAQRARQAFMDSFHETQGQVATLNLAAWLRCIERFTF